MGRVIFKIGAKTSCYLVEDEYIIRCNNKHEVYDDYKKLNEYVNNPFFLRVRLDQTECIFTKQDINHYETWLTDGVWVWSSDLVHYAENHFFQWPKEFLDHVISMNYSLDFDMERLFAIGNEYRQNFDLMNCKKLA